MKLKTILQSPPDIENIPTHEQFQLWIDTVFQHIHNHVPSDVHELCIRIVDQKESQHLNETYRQTKGATNVLAFPTEPEANEPQDSLGDIALCHEIVLSEAQESGIPITNHWAHLTVHGTLHLLGYDHMNEQDAILMENLEIKILNDLGIDNPYEEPDFT